MQDLNLAKRLNRNLDMFPQTAKTRKRLWICSLARKMGKDIQPIQTSHVETVVQLQKAAGRRI